MTHSPEIIKKRKTGIGGSEVPAILGLDKFSSPYQVWLRKTGREPAFTGNAYTKAGIILESAVVEFFTRETKYRIIKTSSKPQVYVHPKADFAIGMPDRLYIGNRIGKGILECKTMQGETDDVYDSWFAQLQWYLGVVGLMYGGVAWLEHGLNFKYKEYEYDPDFFNFMLEEVRKFWENHILTDTPPDPINIQDVNLMFTKHIEGSKIEATPEMIAVHADLKTIRGELKALEAKEAELTDWVKFAMRDTETVINGTKPLFTWRTSAPIQAFDKNKLKEADPDAYNAYCYKKPGVRMFLIK
jgi:predicted phage-related endonuclease